MTWKIYINFLKADIGRYGVTFGALSRYFWRTVEFRFVFFLRTTAYLKGKFWLFPFFVLSRLIYGHMVIKYGIAIPYTTSIGPGLFIGHHGGIVVNQEVVIGKNCNINHDVTLGVAYGGKYPGCPVIGENVFLGTGCRVFGGVKIGDDVAVGANCVVTKSVSKSSVVVGVPGNVISKKGSGDYVVHCC